MRDHDQFDSLRMKALKGFVHAHNLFAPTSDDKEAKPLTPAEMQALIDAMRNSQGDKWERPKGRLQQSDFFWHE